MVIEIMTITFGTERGKFGPQSSPAQMGSAERQHHVVLLQEGLVHFRNLFYVEILMQHLKN